jgi:hypothetical protein
MIAPRFPSPDEQAIGAGNFRPVNYVNGNEGFAPPAPAGRSLRIWEYSQHRSQRPLVVVCDGSADQSYGQLNRELDPLAGNDCADCRFASFRRRAPEPGRRGKQPHLYGDGEQRRTGDCLRIVLSNAVGAGQIFVSAAAGQEVAPPTHSELFAIWANWLRTLPRP